MDIIRLLENGQHEVLTGVALVDPATGRRELFVDRARVRVGAIGGERIGEYIASGGWRGKAGGYNLAERIQEGWPIEYEGDPTTIMGLPMRILPARLEAFARGSALAPAAGPG
jgi:septum formation protein